MPNPIPSLAIITICLNEMEWLPYLYQQHKNWPGLVKWAFIEGADPMYRKANPDMVNDAGLSVDGTSQFLQELEKSDPRVKYVPYNSVAPVTNRTKELGKVFLKSAALKEVQEYSPSFVIALDADEFYPIEFQPRILELMSDHADAKGFIFPRREIWRPPSMVDNPLFSSEVIGGFWDIPCSHWWRWEEGMRFKECHNTPYTSSGRPFNEYLADLRGTGDVPYMIHMGFASTQRIRLAKNSYYVTRGESTDRQRKWYVSSRDAWRTWRPWITLPRGAKVVPYSGLIPECFLHTSTYATE